jgi:MFS family permease
MAMSSPVFIDLSFTSQEIASISKAYGFMLMISGGVISGILTAKIGISRSILICGSLQLLSPLMFVFLSMVGHDMLIFTITITVQNFCCGLGNTAILIYFSSLCSSELIATQYSIISSFGSFVRIILSFLSGICANYMDWPQLFLFTTLFSMLFVPAFLRIRKI